MILPRAGFTTETAAEWLTDRGMSVSGRTVRRWCETGQIAATSTLGRQYRITLRALESLFTSNDLPVPQPTSHAA